MNTLSKNLLEQEKIDAIREQLTGFIMEEVINPKGEFYCESLWDRQSGESSSRR